LWNSNIIWRAFGESDSQSASTQQQAQTILKPARRSRHSYRLDSGDDFATCGQFSEDTETAGMARFGLYSESSLRNTDPTTRDAVLNWKPASTRHFALGKPGQTTIGYQIVKLVSKEPAGNGLGDLGEGGYPSQLRDRRNSC